MSEPWQRRPDGPAPAIPPYEPVVPLGGNWAGPSVSHEARSTKASATNAVAVRASMQQQQQQQQQQQESIVLSDSMERRVLTRVSRDTRNLQTLDAAAIAHLV
eukprot:COSAG06_NODE_2487_length_6775_cov_4.537448_2_plen_103_part_00